MDRARGDLHTPEWLQIAVEEGLDPRRAPGHPLEELGLQGNCAGIK
jgi:hypothetical protein